MSIQMPGRRSRRGPLQSALSRGRELRGQVKYLLALSSSEREGEGERASRDCRRQISSASQRLWPIREDGGSLKIKNPPNLIWWSSRMGLFQCKSDMAPHMWSLRFHCWICESLENCSEVRRCTCILKWRGRGRAHALASQNPKFYGLYWTVVQCNPRL